MKAIALLPVIAGLVAAQTLEEKWNLEEPTFGYEDRVFNLTYTFGSAVTSAGDARANLYLFRALDEPNSELNCMQGQGENAYASTLATSALSLSESDFGPSGNAAFGFENQETVLVAIDTTKISDDNQVFTDNGNGSNTIAFCIRYGMYAGTQEVNFLETLVTLNVTLRGEFVVEEIAVAPKDKLERTAEQVYNLEAYQCSGIGEDGIGTRRTQVVPFNQGDVITVCVLPDPDARAANVYMRNIEEFEYFLMDTTVTPAVETSTTQPAILNSVPQLGLTTINQCRGTFTCMIETILFATFYAQPGTVRGRGTGVMQFGTATARKLRARNLEEAAAPQGEFDVQFLLENNDSFQRNSGASVQTAILALLGSAAAAFIM